MLVDTDVLVWYLRGSERAAEALERLDPVRLSVVTYMELVQGMRSKDELRVLRSTLAGWGATVRMIDEAVSTRAMLYVEQHFHSHALRLADALIAATAVADGVPLLTANDKHYRVLADLAIEVFRP
jgi:predicted nucleic acid-binding protein